MTIDSIVGVAELVGGACMIAGGITMAWCYRSLKRNDDALHKLRVDNEVGFAHYRKHGPDPKQLQQFADQLHASMVQRIASVNDLVERTLTDLEFLHGAKCPERDKECPICSGTIPQLTQLLAILKGMSILEVGFEKSDED